MRTILYIWFSRGDAESDVTWNIPHPMVNEGWTRPGLTPQEREDLLWGRHVVPEPFQSLS